MSKQLGLDDSKRVRKICDRGEADFYSAHGYPSQQHLGLGTQGIPDKTKEVYETVGLALDRAKVCSVMDIDKWYLPRHKLHEILNPQTVRAIVGLSCFKDYPDKQRLTDEICYGETRRLKLLAVLIGIEKLKDFPRYMKDGVDDQCLPMTLDTSQQRIFCRRHDEYHETIDSYNRPDYRVRFSQWSYSLSAPYINCKEDIHSHFVLSPSDVFPMHFGHNIQNQTITTTNGLPMSVVAPDVNLYGGYSEVYKVKIEKSHCNFGSLGIRNPNGLFALKKLTSNNRDEFNLEMSSLLFSMDNSSGKSASKHLVQLLATFEVSDPESRANYSTYYLLFDWAEGNLKDFWRENGDLVRNNSHCEWISQQFHEICLALQCVHNERDRNLKFIEKNNLQMNLHGRPVDFHSLYGRHGDIKPDNFLWFRPGNPPGLLALSDFGLGRLHTQVSRSNQNPGDIPRTSTYIAPEFDLSDGKVSRASDIFSLGCVFLEHITWFLLGFESVIEDFPNRRMDKDILPNFKADKFFMVEVDEHGKTKNPTLKSQVRDWIQKLQHHEKCSWYLYQLLEIIRDSMLEPDRKKRIDIACLAKKMEDLRKSCDDDPNYYLEARPNP
ncbi:protein kinase [Jackrogersella minutella]|nr:protein kinase [Jackrogersella minutella]